MKDWSEIINIPLGSSFFSNHIGKWYVSRVPLLSGHRQHVDKSGDVYQDLHSRHKTDWFEYRIELKAVLRTVKTTLTTKNDIG